MDRADNKHGGRPDEGANASDLEQMRAALAGAAGIATYLPAGEDYVEEIRALDAARLAKLDL